MTLMTLLTLMTLMTRINVVIILMTRSSGSSTSSVKGRACRSSRGRSVRTSHNITQHPDSLYHDVHTQAIGKHPLFRVVGVRHHSPNCLVEDAAMGPTVAKVTIAVAVV